MCGRLAGIRAREAGHALPMARIRACNMAMMFFIMPVSSLITFAVVSSALAKGNLRRAGDWHVAGACILDAACTRCWVQEPHVSVREAVINLA